ncbi:hypothetical protein VK70_01780 [Paenibacillus durus ATCC 35681]|uniref:Uncharacterized protein n=1 Tax=Paenibacillus durus ATCC 35681 TaxID=1333534 RepID=A0A0F7F6G6_PAEDU|nr:hypothetical protein VK70_01780 [Paenibacillus durus ATCC 35681]
MNLCAKPISLLPRRRISGFKGADSYQEANASSLSPVFAETQAARFFENVQKKVLLYYLLRGRNAKGRG